MPNPDYRLLDEWTAYNDQTAERMELVQMGPHKVRFHIVTDTYPNQRRAYAQIWNPGTLCWQHLCHLHHANMATPGDLGYRKPDQRDPGTDFQHDLDRLIDLAETILF